MLYSPNTTLPAQLHPAQPTSKVVLLQDGVRPQHRARTLRNQRSVLVQLSAVLPLLGVACVEVQKHGTQVGGGQTKTDPSMESRWQRVPYFADQPLPVS